MNTIGLLLVANEDDIIERTLHHNTEFVDCFYALDGSEDTSVSRQIIRSHPKCADYLTDLELERPKFPEHATDGYRQALYECAVADHGHDNWFLLLHADEVWTFDPRELTDGHIFDPDAFIFRVPFFFPRDGEPWDPMVHPIDQLHWHLGPGWPEFRMFRGSDGVEYDPYQHFDVAPKGIRRICFEPNRRILHYPYRAPHVQRDRAALHQRTGFDPDNYMHIIEDDEVYWTDEMIRSFMDSPHFSRMADKWEAVA